MDDSSKSQHSTDPTTASSYPPGFGIDSARSSSLSVGNNPLPPPPPPPSPQGGTTTSTTKRKNITDHGQKEEIEDDADSQFIPIKHHRTESSTADESEAGISSTGDENAASPRRKEEFNLLYDILDFYKRTGRYPYDHFKDLNEFNKDWVGKRSRVYESEDELGGKMRELHERFLNNFVKTRNGEILEDLMDETEVEIYLLSHGVWVLEDDDDDNGGKDSSKDEKISKDSSEQQETGDEVDDHTKDSSDEKGKHDSKDSSDQQQETDGDDESKGLSSKDSKDSLSKDSSKDSTKWNSEDLASKDSSPKDSSKGNSQDLSSKDSKDSNE